MNHDAPDLDRVRAMLGPAVSDGLAEPETRLTSHPGPDCQRRSLETADGHRRVSPRSARGYFCSAYSLAAFATYLFDRPALGCETIPATEFVSPRSSWEDCQIGSAHGLLTTCGKIKGLLNLAET